MVELTKNELLVVEGGCGCGCGSRSRCGGGYGRGRYGRGGSRYGRPDYCGYDGLLGGSYYGGRGYCAPTYYCQSNETTYCTKTTTVVGGCCYW